MPFAALSWSILWLLDALGNPRKLAHIFCKLGKDFLKDLLHRLDFHPHIEDVLVIFPYLPNKRGLELVKIFLDALHLLLNDGHPAFGFSLPLDNLVDIFHELSSIIASTISSTRSLSMPSSDGPSISATIGPGSEGAIIGPGACVISA